MLHTFPSSNLQNLSSSKSLVFNMSSSHGDKRSSDVEMGEATSPAPIPTSLVKVPACVADHLSFREKLVRRQAEKEQVRAGAELPSSSALAVAPGHGTEGVTPRDTELSLARSFRMLRLYLLDRPRLRFSSKIRRGLLTLCRLLRPGRRSF